MAVGIRPFAETDCNALIDVLQRNGQFGYPDVEGAAAMRRVAACEAAVFLVAEVDGQARGLIRAVYDGSRALIHLLSVHPDVQRRGIGRDLVAAVEAELRRRGAPSVSVTVTETSAGFWERHGFSRLPVQLMLKAQW
jgi:N-acetylglutamate synthase-like GNAT family acetyltransferase